MDLSEEPSPALGALLAVAEAVDEEVGIAPAEESLPLSPGCVQYNHAGTSVTTASAAATESTTAQPTLRPRPLGPGAAVAATETETFPGR